MSTYTTQGDMWDSIAWRALGSVRYTGRLMCLNPQYLPYYTFPAGIVLTLPEPETEAAPLRPPWKEAAG